VFFSENAIVFDDVDHLGAEERFIIVGFSLWGKLLLSCFCERGEDGNTIRIISARKLTKKETNYFFTSLSYFFLRVSIIYKVIPITL
jgi:uncharacterized protein